MKKLSKIALALAATFVLANGAEVLKIGTEGTYAPFTYHENGKLVGYDVEVATEAAKRAGYEPKFFETNWDAMFAGLNAKRFDMIANQVSGGHKKRAELYLLSTPYTYTSAAVAVRKDENTINSLADIKGRKIAQTMGSNYYDTAVDNGAKVVPIENLAPALKAVSQGRVEGTMNDKLAILNYLQLTGDKNVKIAFETAPGYSVFAYRKGYDELKNKIDAALESMRKDGTLAKISQKYFGADVSKP